MTPEENDEYITMAQEIDRLRNIVAIQQKQIERLLEARDAEMVKSKALQEFIDRHSKTGGTP